MKRERKEKEKGPYREELNHQTVFGQTINMDPCEWAALNQMTDPESLQSTPVPR